MILPTQITLQSVKNTYPNSGEAITVLQEARGRGIINTQGVNELNKISRAIKKRMLDAQSKGKDPYTDLAGLSLDNSPISDLRGNPIELPVTLPNPYTIIGILSQVQVGNLY